MDAVMKSYEYLLIGGQRRRPASSRTIDVVSPHTEQVIGRVPDAAPADVDAAVEAARTAFDTTDWALRPARERAEIVARFAELYAARLAEMADLITAEMGSPTRFSRAAQSARALMMVNTNLALAEVYPWEERREGSFGAPVIVRREAIGVVAAIASWNGPQLVAMSKITPALLAGNTVVFKPAPETPLDAYVMAEMLDEAGLPPGVLSIVPAGRETAEYLVAHPGVDKVAFTGSTVAGRKIGAICGEQLKRCTLELGGKSAAIILDDADLGRTVEGLRGASLANSGQACVLQTRILASRDRYDEVVDAVGALVESMPVGDPMDPATEIGPLAAARQRDRVNGYIELGQKEGARLVVGGTGRPDGLDTGWYVRPTVFADVSNDMRIAREEIFGPVLAVIPYDDVDDAVRIANDSDYGLAGSVWTADAEAGLDVARRVRTGSYGINQYGAEYRAPFGGYKKSGVGREFGPEGIDIYTELKTIVPEDAAFKKPA
jgi:aldehyde dehydrogenase (NAD+)